MKKSLFNFLTTFLLCGICGFASAQLSIKVNEKVFSKNDFTGSWLKSPETVDAGDTIVFDMSQAVCSGPYLLVPFSIISDDVIYSIDFSMQFDNSKITFEGTLDYKSYLNSAANFNTFDSTLRYTSFSFSQPIDHDTCLGAIRFNLLSGPVVASDFDSILTFLNGDACSFKLIDAVFPVATITASGPLFL